MEVYGIVILVFAILSALVGLILLPTDEEGLIILGLSLAFILGGLILGSAIYTNFEKRAIKAGVAQYEGSVDPKTGEINRQFVWITQENNKKEEAK